MKHLIKILSTALAICLIFSFGIIAEAKEPSEQAQINLIFSSLSQFRQDESAGKWYYAITDFDGNGRLEILTAAANGTATSASLWEVNEKNDGFLKSGWMLSEGESFPDVLTENADTFTDPATGIKYYIFEDATTTADSFSSEKCAITLLSGNIVYKLLAARSTEQINGFVAINFKDAAGNIITPEEYNDVVSKTFAGYSRSSTSFGWFRYADAEASPAALENSYMIFIGEKEPDELSIIREDDPSQAQVAPAPEAPAAEAAPSAAPEAPAAPGSAETGETPKYTPEGYEIVDYNPGSDLNIVQYNGPAAPNGTQPNASSPNTVYVDQPQEIQIVYPTPAPTPAFVPLSVTRNPTNELRRAGDTARFVACATTVERLAWTLVAPNGTPVGLDSFYSFFPNSGIDGSTTTLTITNVTPEMNGWGAYCTFTTADGRQSVTTNTAYITMR